MTYKYSYASPLGEITLAADDDALNGLWFVGQKYYADTLQNVKDCKGINGIKDLNDRSEDNIFSIFQQTINWLDIYFSGKEPDFMPTISLKGTPFQMEVWAVLKEIPYGQTMTYGEIAARISRQRGISRMSAQAVGSSVSRNPISILVPCHRVVGANGSLTGYAGGIKRKMALLELEKRSISSSGDS